MNIDSIRFRGLHFIDLSRLTERQRYIFGNDSFITKSGWKRPFTDEQFNSLFPNHIKPGSHPMFPQALFSFPGVVWGMKLEEPQSNRHFAAYYSRFADGDSFEADLVKYISAFEKKYTRNKKKISHVFDPSLQGEKVDFRQKFKSSEDIIEKLPGLREALGKLNLTG